MNIDAIKESLKARLDLFKLNILLIVGLFTGGLAGIYLQESIEKRDIVLIILGFISLNFFIFFAIKSYIKIIYFIKKLES